MSNRKPIALDLFCGAGGATRGLQLAGYEVWGVDLSPQPHYCGDEFYQEDVTDLGWRILTLADLVWASPPCQHFSKLTPPSFSDNHVDLIDFTRRLCQQANVPYIIENVEGARGSLHNPTMLCGTMFGLPLWRHRYFECYTPTTGPFTIFPPHTCNHSIVPVVISGRPGRKDRDGTVLKEPLVSVRKEAMQTPWMTKQEMDQAIPPAYSEYLGRQFAQALNLYDKERKEYEYGQTI